MSCNSYFSKVTKVKPLEVQTRICIHKLDNELALWKIHPMKEPVINNTNDPKSVVLNHKLLPGNNVQLLKVNRLNLTAKVNLH